MTLRDPSVDHARRKHRPLQRSLARSRCVTEVDCQVKANGETCSKTDRSCNWIRGTRLHGPAASANLLSLWLAWRRPPPPPPPRAGWFEPRRLKSRSLPGRGWRLAPRGRALSCTRPCHAAWRLGSRIHRCSRGPQVFHYFEDPAAVLGEARRILQRDGTLIVSHIVPFDDKEDEAWWTRAVELRQPLHRQMLTRAELADWLASASFKVTDTVGVVGAVLYGAGFAVIR